MPRNKTRGTSGKGAPTDPLNKDTDGDGVNDGEEVNTIVDPETGETIPDPDATDEKTDPNTKPGAENPGDKPATPEKPEFANPSTGATADDPASCEVPPFVTVANTPGVKYTVTVDGKELTPDANGHYVYGYGQTVVVKATPEAGYTLTGTTEWTYTAEQAQVCVDPTAPNWDDTTTKPGESVEIPNKGGDVEAGTTVEVTDGPGKAEINPDGTITVTPTEDAKPGDKIVVEVKDPEGKVIDTVTVTITEQDDGPLPSTPGSDQGSLDKILDGSSKGSSKDLLPIIGAIGGAAIVGSLIDGALKNPGSSTPAPAPKPAPEAPAEQAPAQGDHPLDHAGPDAKAQAGAGQAAPAAPSAPAAESGTRGGQLAVSGVSGVAIALGASVLALALGGALLALRRRES